MPRFAFALPTAPDQGERWRADARRMLGSGAKAHRSFLLDRGIFRERIWSQRGESTPELTLFLWDCDDVEVATRVGGMGSEHERWLFETVIGHHHGQEPSRFTFPEPEVLSGTTAMATAAAGTQTMFALPIPPEGTAAVRQLIERIESGDLATEHSAFLTDAFIREEWIWLQEQRDDTPALLLVHWIGDDLAAAWERLTHVGTDPYARVLRDALFTLIVGVRPSVVARWEIEQLLAMHVRRSDSDDTPLANRLALRLGSAFPRRRWDIIQRSCKPEVLVHDPHPHLVPAASAVKLLTDATATSPGPVVDILTSERQILCILQPSEPGPTTAVLMGVQDGLIAWMRLFPDWPCD